MSNLFNDTPFPDNEPEEEEELTDTELLGDRLTLEKLEKVKARQSPCTPRTIRDVSLERRRHGK